MSLESCPAKGGGKDLLVCLVLLMFLLFLLLLLIPSSSRVRLMGTFAKCPFNQRSVKSLAFKRHPAFTLARAFSKDSILIKRAA